MTILWPPPYYLLRDRIPFVLTLIYTYFVIQKRGAVTHKVPLRYQNLLGWGLYFFTWLCLVFSVTVYIIDGTFMRWFGFKWSLPSPIQWSIFTILNTVMLRKKNYPIYTAYYYAFMTALAGGWIYEIFYGIPYWVRSGFAAWNWMKINAAKVFFIEFQVLAIPIVWYNIRNSYRRNKYLWFSVFLALIFYMANIQIRPILYPYNRYLFKWVLRIPAAIFLTLWLQGAKQNE